MEYAGLRLSSHRARQKEVAELAALSPAKATAAPSAQARSHVSQSFTQADVDSAVVRAVSAERARVATVFAAEASRGRERVCADLLTSPKNFAGSAIVTELPHMPTDRERAAQSAAARQAEAEASWDRVYERTFGKGEKPAAESADVWDKAIAATPAYGPTAKSNPSDSWDRAYDRAFGKGAN